MRRIAFLLTALSLAASLSGQVNAGADYYYLGEYEKAQTALEKEQAADPARAYFYLGEIAFAQGNLTKAAEFYDKALAVDPNNLRAQVGKLKLLLKSDPVQADAKIKELIKQHKKNVAFFVALGRGYFDLGMIDKAQAMTEEARKIDKTYPETYLLRGDIAASLNDADVGLAAREYEQAKYFDPDNLLAYMKLAHIYEHRNLSIALDELKTAIAKDPNYVIADGMLARLYTTHGRYAEAIAALTKYFQNVQYSADDVERMARAYYFGEPDRLGVSESQKYEEAMRWVEKGLALNPDHFVLNRYKMYLNAKLGNTAEGIANAEKFFALRSADSTYIPLDYTTYGSLLQDVGRIKESLEQYDKAIAIDPDKLDTYEKVVAMAREIKHYGLGAEYYQKFVSRKKELEPETYETDRLVDLNTLGTLYYQAGTLITAEREPALVNELMNDPQWQERILAANLGANKDSLSTSAEYFARFHGKYNLRKAENVFGEMIELAPDSYTGYYYMARTQNALFPGQEGVTSGMPKQYYEKTVSVIENRDNSEMSALMTRALKEGLGYLAYYYYLTDDLANARLFSEKLLAIDPTNANAIAILEDIKSR